ncbi:hypothetical protein [Helicobacter sp. 11S02629-2]|uniref:hypothetical protein n=1 Tax=Helicobacter sp. 11S02629-2 TaxID=1476195 RepID=UPI00117B1002|nr:hypothetical protein [Helicobacter sp. 11S02629-2]
MIEVVNTPFGDVEVEIKASEVEEVRAFSTLKDPLDEVPVIEVEEAIKEESKSPFRDEASPFSDKPKASTAKSLFAIELDKDFSFKDTVKEVYIMSHRFDDLLGLLKDELEGLREDENYKSLSVNVVKTKEELLYKVTLKRKF